MKTLRTAITGRKIYCYGLVLVLLALTGSPANAEEIGRKKTPVAIMEFTTKGGVTQAQMDALGDLLAETVRKMGQYRVIGSNDITSVLKAEERKALAGCSDVSCMAEIGGALGVRWMVVGNVSKFGKAFLLNVKLIDAQDVKVVGSASVKVTGGEEALLDAVPKTAGHVFEEGRAAMFPPPPILPPEKKPEAAPPAPRPPPEETTAAAPPQSEPVPVEAGATTGMVRSSENFWGHFAFWGGLGLAALGGVGLGLGKAAADDYAGGDMGAWEKSRTMTAAGFASLGVGAALMATGVVLWLVDPGPPRCGTPALLTAPTAGGALLGLQGRF